MNEGTPQPLGTGTGRSNGIAPYKLVTRSFPASFYFILGRVGFYSVERTSVFKIEYCGGGYVFRLGCRDAAAIEWNGVDFFFFLRKPSSGEGEQQRQNPTEAWSSQDRAYKLSLHPPGSRCHRRDLVLGSRAASNAGTSLARPRPRVVADMGNTRHPKNTGHGQA